VQELMQLVETPAIIRKVAVSMSQIFVPIPIHAVQLDGISTVNVSHCCFITLMSVENGNV